MIFLFRTAARDPAVFGNGNGPLRDQLNASPPRSWQQVHRKNVQRGCDLELPGLWSYLSKTIERKNMNQKTTIKILHEEWALEQGYLVPSNKRQAASIKRQAASVNAEIYNDTDYKATSIKRQALTEIPDN